MTGANKGIGYGIVAGLARQFEGILYLTGVITSDDLFMIELFKFPTSSARNPQLGSEALAKLQSEVTDKKCAEIRYHQLDISDRGSIESFRQYLNDAHGGLDILVNNAGIAYKHDSTAPFGEQAEVTCGVNFFGTLNLCDALKPLIRPHGR